MVEVGCGARQLGVRCACRKIEEQAGGERRERNYFLSGLLDHHLCMKSVGELGFV